MKKSACMRMRELNGCKITNENKIEMDFNDDIKGGKV